MVKELKIRLTTPLADTEKALLSLGAVFESESKSRHTYFRQPPGHVIKLVESLGDVKLLELQQNNGEFEIIRQEIGPDVQTRYPSLVDQYGVASVLDMQAKNYYLGDMKFGLYTIDRVGTFLIQTAKQPDSVWFAKLGIQNPEYITVPFNELPQRPAPSKP